MRGKRAKELRRFAQATSTDLPWVEYSTVRMSMHSNGETRVLSECNRAYYQLLKRIWKVV